MSRDRLWRLASTSQENSQLTSQLTSTAEEQR
jgi:hypothetical protein